MKNIQYSQHPIHRNSRDRSPSCEKINPRLMKASRVLKDLCRDAMGGGGLHLLSVPACLCCIVTCNTVT